MIEMLFSISELGAKVIGGLSGILLAIIIIVIVIVRSKKNG